MPDFTVIHHAIGQVPNPIYLRWIVLLVMSVVFGVALYKQNKHIRAIHEDMPSTPVQDYIVKAAKARGMIAFMLWSMLAAFVIFYDVNYQVTLLHAYSRDAHPQDTTTPRSIASATPVINVDMLSNESSLNDIKSSYEDAFVSYMLLQGCEAADAALYTKLNNKLMTALAPFDSPTIHAHNIVIAASGTYGALYAHTPCEAQYIEPTQKNLAVFVK